MLMSPSCRVSTEHSDYDNLGSNSEVVIRKRADGTVSSVNQVDESGMVDGIRVTFYGDGKTTYSRTTFSHGIKQGPAVRYYRNGQVFEHSGYQDGKKQGPARKFYMNGTLMAEYTYDQGIVQPGLEEFDRQGVLIDDYPEIKFREFDHLASRNRIDLEMYCTRKGIGVKYYRRITDMGNQSRVYLISEKGSAMLQFYVKPGETINENIEITAEIPTELGNILVKNLSYKLIVSNPG